MERLAIALGLVSCAACGDGELLYIERLVPFDGPSLVRAEVDDAEPVTSDGLVDRNLISPVLVLSSENNAADTDQNLCVIGDECSAEYFTAHFGWVTLRNDQPDPESIDVTETVNGYEVEFAAETVGLNLPPFRGNARAVIGPSQTATFQTTLLPFEYKELVGSQLSPQDPPLLYRVRLTLLGDRNLELSASTTLLIGPFNNCAEDGIPIDPADALIFCQGE